MFDIKEETELDQSELHFQVCDCMYMYIYVYMYMY